MQVRLPYGEGALDVELPGERISLIEPRFVPGLADEHAAFLRSVRAPLGDTRPLRECVREGETVAVCIPDATRPLPGDRLLPWLFAELPHVRDASVVIVVGTGSHRASTHDELRRMVGDEVLRRHRITSHDAHDPGRLVRAGAWDDGQPVLFAREWAEADRRIVLGFVEPHFMAGFSGGYKGVFPAVADVASIVRYHGAAVIADPRSTWGVIEGNPTQQIVRRFGALRPVDFCVNVTLNRERAITGFFCGEPAAAHDAACALSREIAMVRCERPFPIVVTTNSGHPLDQNLYQSVKGMSAGAQIVAENGLVVQASRCGDGFPAHGNFKRLLFEHDGPRALLDAILAPGFSVFDQWEAQILAQLRLRARIALRSELPDDEVRRAHLEPIADVAARVREELRALGDAGAPIAVLPEGPMTIPFLA